MLPVANEEVSVSIALEPDHAALAEAVKGFIAHHSPTTRTREQLDELSAGAVPEVWRGLIDQGFATVHLPEPHGGGGHLALAAVLEETGKGLLPGPLLPTVITSSLVARSGGREDLVERFANGAIGATAVQSAGLTATRGESGYVVDGATVPMLGAVGAEIVVLGARSHDGEVWFALDVEASGLKAAALPAVDLTRGIGRFELDGLQVGDAAVLAVGGDTVAAVAAALFAAEAVGIAGWYVKAASEYAHIREQFGRTIGSFQAIKHKLARMFVQLQVMSAAAWDAARSLDEDEEQALLACAGAAIVCLPSAAEMGLDTVTLFGGIGYTWEHDTHLFWRRGMALNSLIGPVDAWQQRLGNAARTQQRRFDIELVDEDPEFRAKIAAQLAHAETLEESARRTFLAEAGLVLPHYPVPYGLAASAVEQIVIAQEYMKSPVEQPKIVIGEWALPTILAHGTDEQKDYFVPATLHGDIKWCQLFSEPGAGSDLASLATKAERVEGGWKLTGQKIWTSNATKAQWGMCLARTDSEAPKHKGITYFLVDMASEGLDVRPLREANGKFLFNEVFLDGVFVPDQRVVGEINNGWRLARTTLSNERVSMGGMGGRSPIADAVGRDDLVLDRSLVDRGYGALTAEKYALSAMHLRDLLRRLSGLQPGVEGSAMKVAAGAHETKSAVELMKWVGPTGAVAEGTGGDASMAYLSMPPMLIGGGTLEIQLNVIAERILGLPRD